MTQLKHAHSIKIRMLASGSSGNSILLSQGNTNLLVDAGLTCKELARRLAGAQLTPRDISGVIVTHEHRDHIRGIGVLSRKYRIPIYMNAATSEAVRPYIDDVPTAEIFSTGDLLAVGNLTLQTYPVPHDAVEPIGLTVQNSSCRIGIALDMGYPTHLVKQRLQRSSVLILEFNHDPEMLRKCSRPWEVKQRILSKTGHMSNGDALELLCELLHDRLSVVVLAHLSREANCPRHVHKLVSERLREVGRGDIDICVSAQDEVSRPIIA